MSEKILEFLKAYNELPNEAAIIAAHAYLEGLNAGCKIRKMEEQKHEEDVTESA